MLCKNYYFNLKRDDDLTEKYWIRWGFSEALIEKDKKKINHEIKEEYINHTVVKNVWSLSYLLNSSKQCGFHLRSRCCSSKIVFLKMLVILGTLRTIASGQPFRRDRQNRGQWLMSRVFLLIGAELALFVAQSQLTTRWTHLWWSGNSPRGRLCLTASPRANCALIHLQVQARNKARIAESLRVQ